jgi:hypothetical protein
LIAAFVGLVACAFAMRQVCFLTIVGNHAYMVSGGGGGALHLVIPASFLGKRASVWHYLRVSVDGAKLTVQAIGTDGKEFDRVALPCLRYARRYRWSCEV